MPISDPEGPVATEWRVRATSVERIGGYPVTLNISFSTDNMSAPEIPAIVQQAVDLLHQSDLFDVQSGSRAVTYTETMTPSSLPVEG